MEHHIVAPQKPKRQSLMKHIFILTDNVYIQPTIREMTPFATMLENKRELKIIYKDY